MSKLATLISLLRVLRRRRKEVLTPLWTPGNVKALAYELARVRHELAAPLSENEAFPEASLPSLVCSGSDWQSAWLPFWLRKLGLRPAFHRKLWEFAYIAQVLSQAHMLEAGKTGIGFGCGTEPLASLFAALGSEVLATDLGADDARAQGWSAGDQHAASWSSIWQPDLCPREVAEARLRFQAMDMNRVPSELAAQFDYCWSSCALEHLGSIGHGLDFIVNSAQCLRPGGVAVHTTELNPDSGPTLESGATVLFQHRHIEELAERLHAKGFMLSPLELRPDEPFLDGYTDMPPYPDPSLVGSTVQVLHLRLLIDTFRTTSVGLLIRRMNEGMSFGQSSGHA